MSEYLDEEEQIARLKSWWDENGTSVLVGIGIAVAGIVGWNWYGSHSEDQIHAAARAYAAYEEADDASKPARLDTLETEFSGTAYHVFALFEVAKSAVEAGDYQKAADNFKRVVTDGQDALLVDMARIRLARVQNELDLTEDALTTLSQVKNEGYKTLVLELQGDIHSAAGNVENAYLAYSAAQEGLREGDERPLLKMKLDNTAPFGEEFVQLTSGLDSALQEASEVLQTTEDLVPDTEVAAEIQTEEAGESVDSVTQDDPTDAVQE